MSGEYSHRSLKSRAAAKESSEGIGMGAPYQGVDREGGRVLKLRKMTLGAWREERGEHEVENVRAVLGKPREETVPRAAPPANTLCSRADSAAPELFLTRGSSNGILNDKQFYLCITSQMKDPGWIP